MNNNQTDIFFNKLQSAIDSKELIKLQLSNRRDKSAELKNIIAAIVKLKKGYYLNFIYRYKTKDITKNYEFSEGIDLIRKALEIDFFNADLYLNSENIALLIKSTGKSQLKAGSPTLKPLSEFSHDKAKNRLIKSGKNVYLRELGITNAEGEVRREMSSKYKQINRYVELLEPYLSAFSDFNDLNVVDMGSGKGYLTFALYDYLANRLNKNIRMTGVEYRNDLVNVCNTIAEKSEFNNLSFVQGTIESTELDNIDILIALHACDTATDEAIYRGIRSDSGLIVCAPCCHKQIRREMNVSNELRNIVKHGILKDRQAEIVTDALRAMIMEAFGYKTSVFEFISTEHTPKNLMIVGEKVNSSVSINNNILEDIKKLKAIFGIKDYYLEVLLGIL